MLFCAGGDYCVQKASSSASLENSLPNFVGASSIRILVLAVFQTRAALYPHILALYILVGTTNGLNICLYRATKLLIICVKEDL
jgi:hypothetical protein